MKDSPAPQQQSAGGWTHAGIAYAAALFVIAALLLALAVQRAGGLLVQHDWPLALFFLVYGLFTISIGYRNANNDYYSFDRISQVASILVLGPVDAAWVNGLASLLYPLHRLWRGVPAREVLYAAMNNSGIMTLIVLAAGFGYTAVGGPLPLGALTGTSILAVLVLVLVMQGLNDLAMLGLSLVSGRGAQGFFAPFSHALELGASATGVLVALVCTRLELPTVALLLAVLAIGMLALRQFALMRLRLERIITERTRSLREKTRELERLASQDMLTGLHNRRHAEGWLARQLGPGVWPAPPLTVALADIDGFKQINDQHSHAAGDEVLRRVAALLRERCRSEDLVARYGGEEFLFCFPRTELREALALCEMLRAAVAGMDWSELGLARRVTLSFGLAVRRPDSTLDSLLRLADERLYAAKHDGRNRVVA